MVAARSKRAEAGNKTQETGGEQRASRKPKLLQSDVPGHSLKEALRVPEVLRDEYGKKPARPLMVAKSLGMAPSTGHFRLLTGAAVAYGLTDGAAQADAIGLTALGRRIVAPTVEGDELTAMREAVLNPRVVREFLTKYDSKAVPNTLIALNVLEELGVPQDAAQRALDTIMKSAEEVGFLLDNKGRTYVNLEGTHAPSQDPEDGDPDDAALRSENDVTAVNEVTPPSGKSGAHASNSLTENRRVFVTHGKNRAIVDQLKELLTFGNFEPVVSVDREAVAVPVPDKVLADMRSCGAGIVHVGPEQTLLDKEGNVHKVLNQNVLIEIGAALALYNRNFILLVEKGTQLPSNLQGLYEVRYEGDKLDYEATMKLLRAFNSFTAQPEGRAA